MTGAGRYITIRMHSGTSVGIDGCSATSTMPNFFKSVMTSTTTYPLPVSCICDPTSHDTSAHCSSFGRYSLHHYLSNTDIGLFLRKSVLLKGLSHASKHLLAYHVRSGKIDHLFVLLLVQATTAWFETAARSPTVPRINLMLTLDQAQQFSGPGLPSL